MENIHNEQTGRIMSSEHLVIAKRSASYHDKRSYACTYHAKARLKFGHKQCVLFLAFGFAFKDPFGPRDFSSRVGCAGITVTTFFETFLIFEIGEDVSMSALSSLCVLHNGIECIPTVAFDLGFGLGGLNKIRMQTFVALGVK